MKWYQRWGGEDEFQFKHEMEQNPRNDFVFNLINGQFSSFLDWQDLKEV